MVDHAKKIKKVNVLSIFWGCFKLWLGGCLKTPLLALLTRLTLVCFPKVTIFFGDKLSLVEHPFKLINLNLI